MRTDAIPLEIGTGGSVTRHGETLYVWGVDGHPLDSDDIDELIAKLQTMAWELGQYRQERIARCTTSAN